MQGDNKTMCQGRAIDSKAEPNTPMIQVQPALRQAECLPYIDWGECIVTLFPDHIGPLRVAKLEIEQFRPKTLEFV